MAVYRSVVIGYWRVFQEVLEKDMALEALKQGSKALQWNYINKSLFINAQLKTAPILQTCCDGRMHGEWNRKIYPPMAEIDFKVI